MVDPLTQVLQKSFGLQQFRSVQREVIEHLLAGGDALVVMPTGSGKSLVYQVPALVLDAPVLVLSPLIALMKDQVDALRRKGIAASFVNSTLDRRERDRRTKQFVAGGLRLLYVTPERFRSRAFLDLIERRPVGLLAVDEAHCASEWGHDFRPDYSRIERIRDLLARPPTVALTATATPDVQTEIRRLVGIPDARLFHTGIERENLFLGATISMDEEDKRERLHGLMRRLSGSGIVYGALIKDLHRLESSLPRSLAGSLLYHGNLSREERRDMQDRFMQGKAPWVLATNAFGMGIDKAAIRSILHYQVPGSVEAYYQEVGRAGRDGAPSYCELLYCEQDLSIQTQFVDWTNPDRNLLMQIAHTLEEWGEDIGHFDLDDLKKRFRNKGGFDGRVDTCLQWLEVLGITEGSFERRNLRVVRPLSPEEIPTAFNPDKKQRDLRRLLEIVNFVRSEECRRVWLNRYFGLETESSSCNACDVCVDREEWLEANFPAGCAGEDGDAVTEPETASQTVTRSEPGPETGTEAGTETEADGMKAGREEVDRSQPRRGDFVEVDGRHLGRVVRVSGAGRRCKIEVESSGDLRVRSYRLDKHRVRIL